MSLLRSTRTALRRAVLLAAAPWALCAGLSLALVGTRLDVARRMETNAKERERLEVELSAHKASRSDLRRIVHTLDRHTWDMASRTDHLDARTFGPRAFQLQNDANTILDDALSARNEVDRDPMRPRILTCGYE